MEKCISLESCKLNRASLQLLQMVGRLSFEKVVKDGGPLWRGVIASRRVIGFTFVSYLKGRKIMEQYLWGWSTSLNQPPLPRLTCQKQSTMCNCSWELGSDRPSVTSLANFRKFLSTNFLTKVDQTFVDFLGYFENDHLISENGCCNFWATFCRQLGHFLVWHQVTPAEATNGVHR